MPITGAFPYDIDNLLGGAVRILYAPTSVTAPATIADVIDMVGPDYDPKAGWLDLGATKESFSYSRGFDVEGWEIQQTAGAVIEEITELSRSVSLSAAEFTPEILKIIEGDTGTISNIPAVAAAGTGGEGAQEKVTFGSFTSLTQYRIAFIARRSKSSGTVTEAGNSNATRGRFFMGVGLRCQISADEAEIEFAKGELSAAGVGFTFFPESGTTEGNEYGAWYSENSGTIATA